MKKLILGLLMALIPVIALANQSPTASQVATNCSTWTKNLSCADTTQQLVDNAVDQLVVGGGVSSVSNSDSTLIISPTTGNVVASMNLSNPNIWSAAQAINLSGIGNTPTDSLLLKNTTAASSGNQQYSPAINLGGQGWKTNTTAASDPVNYRIYTVPVQGSISPSADLNVDVSINNSGYVTYWQFLSSNQAFVTPALDLNTYLLTTATGSGGTIVEGTAPTISAPTVSTYLNMTDGANILVGTSTGTKIGTSTASKLGFFGTTAIAQPTGDILTYLGTSSGLGLIASPTISQADVTSLVASGKTFTASNSLTLSGVDGSTLNVGTGGNLGTAAYTASLGLIAGTYVNGDACTYASSGTLLNCNTALTSGTVTSVTAGSGLSGGTITTTGTISLNLSNAQTWAALQKYTGGDLAVLGSSTGYTLIESALSSTSNNTWTIPIIATDTFAGLGTAQTFTASQTNSTSPGVSASAETWSGAPYTGGSATTNFPLVYLNDGAGPTTFSTAGTEIGINAPSGFAGNAFDYHLNGGSSLVSITSAGNFIVGLTSTTGNLTVWGSDAVSGTIAAAPWQFAGSSGVQARLGSGSATTETLTAGYNYSAFIIGAIPITTASTGTHSWLASAVINTLGTVTSGGATVTNTASLYVGAASAAGTNNYGIYDAGNLWTTNIIDNGLTASEIVSTNGSSQLTSTATTGSGNVVLATSPSLVTPILGTPTSVTLNNTLDVIGGVTMTLGSDASYDMYYRNSSGVLTRLANGTSGQVLTATTSAAPSWASASGGVTSVTSNGGTYDPTASPTTGAVVIASSTSQKNAEMIALCNSTNSCGG